jgi:hypothetical protein
MTETNAGSWRSSSWLTLLIFVVIAHFNPEVLTGSTPIEKYFTFTNFLGMLFYGLQVAIIADLMARYRLRWRTVYLIGLIYGIFEEGFAVQTLLSPNPPEFVNVFRVLGLNITWSIYISIFHAVVSVLSSILIIRLIWPGRVSVTFMRRRHYIVAVPVLITIYAFFIRFETLVYAPEASALVILVAACLVLALLARWSQHRELKPQILATSRGYIKWGVPLILGSGILPLIIGSSPAGALPATALLLAIGYLFTLVFDKMDRDSELSGRKRLTIFALFVGFWLILGVFFRTPVSSVVAFAGVGLQVYFGLRSSSKEVQAVVSEASL